MNHRDEMRALASIVELSEKLDRVVALEELRAAAFLPDAAMKLRETVERRRIHEKARTSHSGTAAAFQRAGQGTNARKEREMVEWRTARIVECQEEEGMLAEFLAMAERVLGVKARAIVDYAKL